MLSYYQPVRYTPGMDWVCLREISGYEEQEVDQTGASAAIRLIDQLLVDAPPMAPKTGNTARQLSLSDRDRVLVGIYSRIYGSKIESTLECAACEAPFDMDFSLETLLQHVFAHQEEDGIKWGEDGSFMIEPGLRLRLPTGEDELATWNLSPEAAEKELLKRCVLEGNAEEHATQIQEAIQQAGPMLATEMAATCPECNHGMAVQFDIQSYLLNALKMDSQYLPHEVHRLASTYKWSSDEILRLPRKVRQTYSRIIESERESMYA